MNPSLLIGTLFATFVLFATLASAKEEQRLLKGTTTDWAENQRNVGTSLLRRLAKPVCGNGVKEGSEACDTGETSQVDTTNCADDGSEVCDSCTCIPAQQAVCGNGAKEGSEECDGSDIGSCDASTQYCDTDCTCVLLSLCGNGELNTLSSLVTSDPPEECDDGNNADGDGCSSSCINEICGDGVVNNNGNEECEPPNTTWCSLSCTIIQGCGNNNIDGVEECDDGNNVDGDGCSSTCTNEVVVSTCGDGVINTGEQCDGVGTCPFGDEYCRSDCTCQPNTNCPNSLASDQVPGAKPQIAMAWVSDQWANFDKIYNWEKGCTNPSDPTDADSNQFKCCNEWLVDQDPLKWSGINTVSLTFAKPTEIADPTICSSSVCNEDGLRKGIPGAITYFKNMGMSLVFISCGGATYTEFWEEVLSTDPEGFGRKCAAIANTYGVGFEIDFEASTDPPLEALERFIRAYRTYEDPTYGSATAYNDGSLSAPLPQSFLTIDLGQGAQFMGVMANWVAQNAFGPDHTKRLNWANAMVGGSRQSSANTIIGNWKQHLNGYSSLQKMPIAPNNLVVSVWSSGRKTQTNCVGGGSTTLQNVDVVDFITNAEPCIELCGECTNSLNVAPLLPLPASKAYTKGLLGYAYWMVGNISPNQVKTCPMGVNIEVYGQIYEGDGDCFTGFNAVDGSASAYPSISGNYGLEELRTN